MTVGGADAKEPDSAAGAAGRLRFVVPFPQSAVHALGDVCARVTKAARFTPLSIALEPPVGAGLRLLNWPVAGHDGGADGAAEFGARLAGEIGRELSARGGGERAAPLVFDSLAVVPDPRRPRAVALLLRSPRRSLRPLVVAMERLAPGLSREMPPPSLTLAALPTPKGAEALHSLLTRSMSAFEIEVPLAEIQLRAEPLRSELTGGAGRAPSVVRSWPLSGVRPPLRAEG